MCISLTNATAYKYDIPIDTISTQSTVIRELRVYPAEGPMPRASEAPFAPDIVRCSKSWTTVDVGCCSQCSPMNGSLGRRRVPRGRCRTSSREIAPQKINRRTPRAGFVGGRGFWRHLLSRCSVCAEVRDGENQRAAEMWSLRSEGGIGLTEDFYFYACGGREKASRGTQETETRRDGNWRNQFASTIKERNSCDYVD